MRLVVQRGDPATAVYSRCDTEIIECRDGRLLIGYVAQTGALPSRSCRLASMKLIAWLAYGRGIDSLSAYSAGELIAQWLDALSEP